VLATPVLDRRWREWTGAFVALTDRIVAQPDLVSAAVASCRTHPASLAGGLPGWLWAYATARKALAPESEDDATARATAHILLDRAADSTHETPVSGMGLFHGSGGLLWATAATSIVVPSLQPAHSSLVDMWLTQVEVALAESNTDVVGVSGVAPASLYDVTDGLAGVARTLAMLSDNATDARTKTRVAAIYCGVLGRLSDLLERHGMSLFVSAIPDNPPAGRHQLMMSYGSAHGSAGVLATLAQGAARESLSPGNRQLLADLIVEHEASIESHQARGLPYLDGVNGEPAAAPRYGRPSWCKGFEGIAANLLYARTALGMPASRVLRHAIVRYVESTRDDRVDDPGLCHGSIGVQVLRAAASASQGGRFHLPLAARAVTDRLLETDCAELFSPSAKNSEGLWPVVDLLDGAPGFVMGILHLANSPNDLPTLLGIALCEADGSVETSSNEEWHSRDAISTRNIGLCSPVGGLGSVDRATSG
jgi:hypothetical protein